ncbi:hypothetical protein MCSF7_02883 [Mycoplasmopsis columbina SF7]|uniref:Helicase/UvrB N-terminal domain-containing protein n=1 Tax=Mycoplasmopsis columbina SF7 TaxID=1037410 RepID=F9UJB8_9BACT|nr:DEAD/DEAH box helicase family protein [Mycoplasmopsis columbina]EGV00461.1 hypothetical protein MCSF7_02883 [Mycoplasmopsis columbina SF7]
MNNYGLRLSNSQDKAVTQLLEYWNNRYDEQQIRKVTFKAPTGSGKTFMIANFIDRAISANNTGKKLFFLVATLSSADLPLQLETKFNEYKEYLENNNLVIKNIVSPSSSSVGKKDYSYNLTQKGIDIMIVGKSSFGSKRIFTEYGLLEAMLDEIKNSKDELEMIYIRDEAHVGGSVKGEKEFESLVSSVADFTIKMTATPDPDDHVVILSERELLNDNLKLLKKHAIFNENLDEENDIDDNLMLDVACQKFKEIKKRYGNPEKEPGLIGINPAMLIQVRSKSSSGKSKIEKDEESQLDHDVEEYIKIIESYGLTWAKYFSDDKYSSNTREKISLKSLSSKNSGIDVVIFKVGPATGWDIPRACMLVQLRKVFSESLNIQTLGRIKRNPSPNYPFDDDSIVHDYYVFSNVINSQNEKMLINWKIKKSIQEENFKIPYGEVKVQKIKNSINMDVYKADLNEIINASNVNNQLTKILKDYNDHNYIVGEEKIFQKANGEHTRYVISKIFNQIDLRIFVLNQRNQFRKYFDDLGINLIDDFFEKIASEIEHQAFAKDMFEYIIYKKFAPLIINAYKKQMRKVNAQINDELYEIKTMNIPQSFIQMFDEEKEKRKDKIAFVSESSLEQKFAYKPKIKNELLLDSKSERVFVNKFKAILNYLPDLANRFTLWSINQPHGGFSFEYLESDQDSMTKKGYPDSYFIIDKKHVLYVEVKGSDKDNNKGDIDKEKTSQLLKSYKVYVNKFKKINNQGLLFTDNQIQSLTMLIYKPNPDDHDEAWINGYSSIETIDNFLADIKNKNNGLTNLENLVKLFE